MTAVPAKMPKHRTAVIELVTVAKKAAAVVADVTSMERPAVRNVYAIRAVVVAAPPISEVTDVRLEAKRRLVVVVGPRTVGRSLRISRRQNWPQKDVGSDALDARITVALGCGGAAAPVVVVGLSWAVVRFARSAIAHCHIFIKTNASSAPIPG